MFEYYDYPVIDQNWFYRLTEEEQTEVIAAAVRMFEKYHKI